MSDILKKQKIEVIEGLEESAGCLRTESYDRYAEYVDEGIAEITRLREENEKMKYFLRHNVFAEKQFGVYFVCGDSGDKDRNGMPKDIYVCPAYGSDIIYRYKRMDSSAPQW